MENRCLMRIGAQVSRSRWACSSTATKFPSVDAAGRRVLDQSFYLIFNAHWEPVEFVLPPEIWGQSWTRVLDTRNGDAPAEDNWQRAARNQDQHRITIARRDAPCCVNRDPLSTYRIQLNSQFGFDDAAEIIPYLEELGIDYLYCSPVFPGSAGQYSWLRRGRSLEGQPRVGR